MLCTVYAPSRTFYEGLLVAKATAISTQDIKKALQLTVQGYEKLVSELNHEMERHAIYHVEPDFNPRHVQKVITSCIKNVRASMSHVLYVYSDFLTEKLLVRVMASLNGEVAEVTTETSTSKRKRTSPSEEEEDEEGSLLSLQIIRKSDLVSSRALLGGLAEKQPLKSRRVSLAKSVVVSGETCSVEQIRITQETAQVSQDTANENQQLPVDLYAGADTTLVGSSCSSSVTRHQTPPGKEPLDWPTSTIANNDEQQKDVTSPVQSNTSAPPSKPNKTISQLRVAAWTELTEAEKKLRDSIKRRKKLDKAIEDARGGVSSIDDAQTKHATEQESLEKQQAQSCARLETLQSMLRNEQAKMAVIVDVRRLIDHKVRVNSDERSRQCRLLAQYEEELRVAPRPDYDRYREKIDALQKVIDDAAHMEREDDRSMEREDE